VNEDGQHTGRAQKPPPASERSARKRQVIVEAATALFLQQGYLGTSVDQIAASAEVSKPTVYRFFSDKEALLSDIVLSTLDQTGASFRTHLASLQNAGDLTSELRQVANSYIALVTQPSVLRLRRLVIGASPQLPDLAHAYYERGPERTLHALADLFQHLASRGLLHVDDPMIAATQFAFLVVGPVLDKSLFCGDHPFSRQQRATQAIAGVNAFLSIYSA
jgi:TetR/AcrR family transcriptional regulator, mexJK operon transcriptional repressor